MDTNATMQSGFNLSMLPNFLFLLSLFLILALLWYRFEYKPYKDDERHLNEPKDRD